MPTFMIDDDTRRAIRFAQTGRKNLCSREAAAEFIQTAVDNAINLARFRFKGPQKSEAELHGIDPSAYDASKGPSTAGSNGANAAAAKRASGDVGDEGQVETPQEPEAVGV